MSEDLSHSPSQYLKNKLLIYIAVKSNLFQSTDRNKRRTLPDIHHINTVFSLESMFKYIIFVLILAQVFSSEKQASSIFEHPLSTKVFGLIDELLDQIHKMQALIIRIYAMADQIPVGLRPYFAGCFTEKLNTSRIEYSAKLKEAELTGIPQMKDQMKQATTLEEQINIMNTTDRIIKDISLNVIKPSLSFVTEVLDCMKGKSQVTIA